MAADAEEGHRPARPANAWRVLVVEDEYYIADDLRRELETYGAEVIGPVPTVEHALALIAEDQDVGLAVLDIRLADGPVWPVVEALQDRNVAFVFATGYSDAELPDDYRAVPLFRKPLAIGRLIKTMIELRNKTLSNLD